MELMFGKHGLQLSKIPWEAMEHLLQVRKHLIMSPFDKAFTAERSQMYAESIHAKGSAIDSCVGFIDTTVLAIALPKDNIAQRVVFDGHKRKHALN